MNFIGEWVCDNIRYSSRRVNLWCPQRYGSPSAIYTRCGETTGNGDTAVFLDSCIRRCLLVTQEVIFPVNTPIMETFVCVFMTLRHSGKKVVFISCVSQQVFPDVPYQQGRDGAHWPGMTSLMSNLQPIRNKRLLLSASEMFLSNTLIKWGNLLFCKTENSLISTYNQHFYLPYVDVNTLQSKTKSFLKFLK